MGEVNTTEVILKRFELCAQAMLDPYLAERARVDIYETTFGSLCLRLRQPILGEVLQKQEVSYPADWWEAFKDHWFPKWAKTRWPVRYRRYVMEARGLYPKLSLPEQNPVINVDKWEEAMKGSESKE